MHFFVAAILGAGLGLAAYLITSWVTGTPVTWKRSLAAAVGGALGGLALTATLGASGAVAASSLRITGATLASGAVSGGTEQAARNVLEGRPAAERVGSSATVAAGAALAFRGLGGVLVRQVGGRLPAPVVRPPVSAEENLGLLSALGRLSPLGVTGDLARRTGRKLTEKFTKDEVDRNDPPPE